MSSHLPDGRGPDAPLWVREGIRQLRLHAALADYRMGVRASVPTVALDSASLAKRLHTEVLAPLLATTWIPDAQSFVGDLQKHSSGTSAAPAASLERSWRVERFLSAVVAGTEGRMSSVEEADVDWKAVLAACSKQNADSQEKSVRDAAIEFCNRRVPKEEEATACWLAEARAVFGWLTLQPELAALETDANRPGAAANNCRSCLLAIEADLNNALADHGCLREGLRRAADQLEEAADALERSRAAGRLSPFSRKKVFQVLSETGSCWPPLAVARWLSLLEPVDRTLAVELLAPLEPGHPGCRRVGEVLRGHDLGVRGATAMLLVLCSRLDQRICQGQADPKLIQDFDKLQDTLGLPVRIQRWDVDSRITRPDVWESLPAIAAGGERTLQSCLVVVSGWETHRLQAGRVEVPKPRHGFTVALSTLRRHPKAGGAVIELCEKLHQRILAAGGTRAWWDGEVSASQDGVPSEEILALYQLVARSIVAAAAEPSLAPVVDELRRNLESRGITVGPITIDPPLNPTAGWFLLTAPSQRPAGVGGCGEGVWGLRGPDGRVVVSNFWLRLPERWARTRPVLAELLAQQPRWLSLRARWPNAACWPAIDAAMTHLFAETELAADPPASPAATALFRTLYDAVQAAEGEFELQLRALAKPIYEALGEGNREAFGLPLDPQTLRPRVETLLAAWRRGHRPNAAVRWIESSQPLGSIVSARLPEADVPASLELSLGDDFPVEDKALVALPSPEGMCREADGLRAGPLQSLFERLQELPLDAHRPRRLQSAVEAFAAEVLTPAGREWFNRFLQAASAIGCDPNRPIARQWMETILGRGWCRCFPAIDLGTGKPQGPVGPPPAGCDYRWEFSVTVPVGEVIPERALAFSPTSEGACATFSRGPRISGSLIDLSHRLLEDAAAGSTPAPLRAALEGLQRAADRQAQGDATLEALAERLGAALDRLCEAAFARGENPPDWDKFLALLRAWGKAGGIDVEPPSWCFGDPRATNDVLMGEGQEPPAACFSRQAPPGMIALQRFGLRTPSQVIRSPQGFRSAGPAPAGYAELRSQIEQEFSQLLPALDYWPQAALDDMLAFVAQQFYIDLWKAVEEGRRGGDAAAQQIQRALLEMLVSEFHLEPFFPETYRDVPESWLEVRAPKGIRRERVVQVVRPGLKDQHGKLRVTAIVEVE